MIPGQVTLLRKKFLELDWFEIQFGKGREEELWDLLKTITDGQRRYCHMMFITHKSNKLRDFLLQIGLTPKL